MVKREQQEKERLCKTDTQLSTDKPTISGAKIRCAHSSKPRVVFHPEHGWICYSFSKRMLGRNEKK